MLRLTLHWRTWYNFNWLDSLAMDLLIRLPLQAASIHTSEVNAKFTCRCNKKKPVLPHAQHLPRRNLMHDFNIWRYLTNRIVVWIWMYRRSSCFSSDLFQFRNRVSSGLFTSLSCQTFSFSASSPASMLTRYLLFINLLLHFSLCSVINPIA